MASSYAHVYVGPLLSLASPVQVGKKKHQRLRSRRSAGYWQWCCPSKSSRRMRSYGTWPACNSVITVPISRTGKGAFTRYLVNERGRATRVRGSIATTTYGSRQFSQEEASSGKIVRKA